MCCLSPHPIRRLQAAPFKRKLMTHFSISSLSLSTSFTHSRSSSSFRHDVVLLSTLCLLSLGLIEVYCSGNANIYIAAFQQSYKLVTFSIGCQCCRCCLCLCCLLLGSTCTAVGQFECGVRQMGGRLAGRCYGSGERPIVGSH